MIETTPIQSGSKSETYELLARQVSSLLEGEHDFYANAANLAALIFHSLPDLNWAGFYINRADDLVLGPFQGKPACVRIPKGAGVCGLAAENRTTVRVADVRQFAGHIACDPASVSEIVLPVIVDGELIGVLDIDSPVAGRFDAEDEDGLEGIVDIFLAKTDLP